MDVNASGVMVFKKTFSLQWILLNRRHAFSIIALAARYVQPLLHFFQQIGAMAHAARADSLSDKDHRLGRHLSNLYFWEI